MACLKSHDPEFSVHRMRDYLICGWRDATRHLHERDFDVDVEGAIEILDTMERASRSYSPRKFGRLADAAHSLKRDFVTLRKNGNRITFTHHEREKSRERSSAAVREGWARGIRRKIGRLKDCMKETYTSYSD